LIATQIVIRLAQWPSGGATATFFALPNQEGQKRPRRLWLARRPLFHGVELQPEPRRIAIFQSIGWKSPTLAEEALAKSGPLHPTGKACLKQPLRRFVLWRLRVQRCDKGHRCGRDSRVVSKYDILGRDFLPVDSLVCVVVGPDGRSLQRNARK
jgi:hypothetical protein